METDGTYKRQLPPQLASLPVITAKVKYEISSGSPGPSLEGPVFDRDGNFYCCRTKANDTHIMRIAPDGSMDEFHHITEGMVVGLAFHQDGRCFATDMLRGTLRQFTPSGELISEVALTDECGQQLRCDCMVFDDDGTLLLTDLRGSEWHPTGAIWQLSPEDNYRTATRFFDGMASPNGIVLSRAGATGPSWDSDALWISESNSNSVVRIALDPEHKPREMQYSPIRVFRNPGKPNVDTLCMDEFGFIYQAIMFGGRVVVLDPEGLPIENVIVPGFEDWKLQYTPNLVIHPERPECYLLASDSERAVVLSFPTNARSQQLFSMK